jgi:hypothetical protein
MATTDQISGSTSVSSVVDRYLGDDWEFTFELENDDGTVDFSSYTFTATTAISGANGTVDSSDAVNGNVTVTVYDTVTSALTQDMDAPDIATSTQSTFTTRVALLGTLSGVTLTYAIVPVRVIRR